MTEQNKIAIKVFENICTVTPGKVLKELMHMNGVTVKDLMQELNVSKQTVSAWITDKSIPTRHKKKLSEMFNVKSDLFTCPMVDACRANINCIDISNKDSEIKCWNSRRNLLAEEEGE